MLLLRSYSALQAECHIITQQVTRHITHIPLLASAVLGTEYIAGRLMELVLRKFHNERSTNNVELLT